MNCLTKKKIKNYYIKNITRKKHNRFIKTVSNKFKNKKNMFKYKPNKKDILQFCSPPNKSYAKSIIKSVNKINIILKNIYKDNIKILWTDWLKNIQLYACLFAEKISNSKTIAKAIEQTSITNMWIKKCGNWDSEKINIYSFLKRSNKNILNNKLDKISDNEEKNIHSFLKKSNKNIFNNKLNKISDKIRKDIWDEYSIIFSKLPISNTIIIIPDKLDKQFLKKTLFKIELPNLITKKVCLVVIKNIDEYIINPHLESKKVFNLKKTKNIEFEFYEYNKTQLMKFFKNKQ